MLKVKSLREIAVSDLAKLPRPIAYVPTMGALHAGHQQLIHEATGLSPHTLVSIFVNPLQFESAQDLEKYPRTHDQDFSLSEQAGAELIWFPLYEVLYPAQPELISSGEIGKRYEGKSRLGHFDGMLTVVKRYFDLIQPEFAIFGEKDWQQLSLIRKMVKDLNLPVKIIASETVREESGLALSSRNARLSESGRQAATIIFQALSQAKKMPTRMARETLLRDILMKESSFTLDYAEEIDSETFSSPSSQLSGDRLIVAGWIEGVRLIDNIAIDNDGVGSNQMQEQGNYISMKGLNS